MTDNEIIQALKCCGRESCLGCPYRGKCHQGNPMIRDALNLINRQKAEIERLKEERDMAVKDIYCSTKCFICKNMPSDGNMTHCPNYSSCGLAYIYFKWRGENNG